MLELAISFSALCFKLCFIHIRCRLFEINDVVSKELVKSLGIDIYTDKYAVIFFWKKCEILFQRKKLSHCNKKILKNSIYHLFRQK